MSRIAIKGNPDCARFVLVSCPCAGIKRHVVGNERVLQERSSEPSCLESCVRRREAAGEA
jgi:hypothetical protein